jgi:hypothetical protein
MRPVFTHPPGISSALYDAALADLATAEGERDAAEAKLVAVGEWVDLTAAIVAEVAGGLDADAGSIAGSLTVTASTTTLDGGTVPCILVGLTTTAATRDGYSEGAHVNLGTVASLLGAAYNPATHGVEIECGVGALGTLNSTTPIVAVVLARGGALTATTPPAMGVQVGFGGAIFVRAIVSGSETAISGNQVAAGSIGWLRVLPHLETATAHLSTSAVDNGDKAAVLDTDTYTTGDTLHLFIGQNTTTAAAASGIKLRFRARIFEIANVGLADRVMGCEAA